MVIDPLRVLDGCRRSSTMHLGRAVLLALAVLPSCAVYDSSLLDTHADVTEATGGGDDTAGAVSGGASGGQSNPAEGGKGSSTSNSGGSSSAVGSGGSGAGGGVGGASNGGTSSEGGTGSASNGGTASGSGGKTGSAGAGAMGSAGAGAGGSGAAAGAPSGGSAGGGGAPINPCDRTKWNATASESSVNPPNPPALAIDGMASTRWSTGATQVGGEWFLLDLGARAAHLTQVVLDSSGSPDDQPLNYKLEVSDDGKSYSLVCTGTGAAMTVITFVDTPARYIRITQTGSDPDANWWSIQELTLTCSPN
jgi:hypothetical protein